MPAQVLAIAILITAADAQNAARGEDLETEPGLPRLTAKAGEPRRESPSIPPQLPGLPGATRDRTAASREPTRALTDTSEVLAEPTRPRVAPWVVFGGSVLAGVAGAVFAVRTAGALESDLALAKSIDLANVSPTIAADIRDQERAVLTNGLATTVLLSASIAGLVTSTILLISD